MVRTEISLFLKNAPGELGRLTTMLSEAKINIDAMTIQDASEYVQKIFRSRGKSIKRVASAASYSSIKKDSGDYALIRLLVDKIDEAIDLLSKSNYIFDIIAVIAITIDNQPGILSRIAQQFGENGINISYVYGSALPGESKSLFIFCPEDIELAASIFKD